MIIVIVQSKGLCNTLSIVWLFSMVGLAQVCACPTQRAPDGWESPRFQAGSCLGVGSGKAALSRPTHPRVTHAVRRLAYVLGKEQFEKVIMRLHHYRLPEMNRYVRTAILIAREECLYFRHREIHPEHILLGLIQVPGSITETVLSAMDVTAQMTRKVITEDIDTLEKISDKSLAQKELAVWNINLDEVLKGIADITTKAGKVAPMNYTPQTSSASFELLSLAAEMVLQQKASHICTDHVLLSLFSLPDWSIKVFLGGIGLWQARVQPTLELMRSDTQEFKDMNNANLH